MYYQGECVCLIIYLLIWTLLVMCCCTTKRWKGVNAAIWKVHVYDFFYQMWVDKPFHLFIRRLSRFLLFSLLSLLFIHFVFQTKYCGVCTNIFTSSLDLCSFLSSRWELKYLCVFFKWRDDFIISLSVAYIFYKCRF